MMKKYFIVLIILISSCQPKKPIDKFFYQVDNVLTSQEKKRLDSCRNTECYMSFIFSNTNQNFRHLSKNPITLEAVRLLDSSQYGHYRQFCIFIAYCKNRIGQKYDFPVILNEIIEYEINQQKLSDELFAKQAIRLAKIAETNYWNIQVKDTLMITCPTKQTYGDIRKYYYWVDDSIENKTGGMFCLVLKKRKEMTIPPEYLLNVKIIGFDKSRIIKQKPNAGNTVSIIGYNDTITYHLGDTMDVNIYDYATVIPKYHPKNRGNISK